MAANRLSEEKRLVKRQKDKQNQRDGEKSSMCIENEDWVLVYTSSLSSCSLGKGPHRESFCPAACAQVENFDAATEDMPAGSVCNLNGLLFKYKLHFNTAFALIDQFFADLSHAVKVLSKFILSTVKLSAITPCRETDTQKH